ncbi:MAG: hypothetical protein MK207_03975 [Saprospiraceae bacterium]|nr:hypothetical protein [Saprospiraceae bacterium]
MTLKYFFITFLLFYSGIVVFGQRDDIVVPKEKKAYAYSSIKELKEGAIVVRLKTNHRKIQLLEKTLKSNGLNKNQRKRHQAILDGTIAVRDAFNNAIADMFLDSFSFCPVYLMYDTCSNALKSGQKEGIFLNKDKTADSSIELNEPHVFLVNYKKSSGEFPFDVLRMQKLNDRLEDPFPYFIQLRESWINQINTPRAARAVVQLDRKLKNFYNRALAYDIKVANKMDAKNTK